MHLLLYYMSMEKNNPPPPIKQEQGCVAPVRRPGGPLPEQVEDLNYRPIKTFADLMAIKDLHQRLKTLMYCRNGKRWYLYPYRSEGLPARDPYPENWDSMLASFTTRSRGKSKASFQNQASVRPSQTTVNEYPTMTHPRRRRGLLYEKHVVRANDPCKLHQQRTNARKRHRQLLSRMGTK
jgi:hypothetical protein